MGRRSIKRDVVRNISLCPKKQLKTNNVFPLLPPPQTQRQDNVSAHFQVFTSQLKSFTFGFLMVCPEGFPAADGTIILLLTS